MNSDYNHILSFLGTIDPFRDLPLHTLEQMAGDARMEMFPAGGEIIGQGDTAPGLYILVRGAVEGIYCNQQCATPLVTVRPGDYFGDLSCMTGMPSQMGFQAIEDSDVVVVPGAGLFTTLAVSAPLRERLFRKTTERMATIASALYEITRKQEYLRRIMKMIEEEAPFLVGSTPPMNVIWQRIPELAADSHPVLVVGEFGVGKELVAEIIHCRGPARNGPFIILDASEISDEEWGEQFREGPPSADPVPGARFSPFGLARGGTLLIKNVDALTPVAQERLTCFLNGDSALSCAGDSNHGKHSPGRSPVRMIFTSHSDLRLRMNEGTFFAPLYDLLSRKVIHLPPLRERKQDILELAVHFMERHSRRYNKEVGKLSPRAREQLLGYDFRRGNIHELEEIIERGVVLAAADTIHSEQLFIGPPAGRAHTWFNLGRIKAFETMIRKGIYPGLFRWIAVAFFFFIMASCFFGPRDPSRNWGTILVWWIWWPWLCAAAFWIGRTWCSFCAYATMGNAVQRRVHLDKQFPKFFKDYDFAVTTILFLFIVWVEEATGMRSRPLYTGMLLLSILGLEISFSILFPRDTWCRYVCPMGNLIGVFAMTSIVEVRSNPDICAHQCTTDECYHGTAETSGCPMFQHLMFVDNNQTCKLCLKCIRTCPHQSVSLNLRAPGWEIWSSNHVRPGMAILVCALMGVLVPVIRPFDSLLLTTLGFVLVPAAMIGLMMAISLMSFPGGVTVSEGFWKTAYGYVPLALAAHIAYQLRYIPGVKDMGYAILVKGRDLVRVVSGLHVLQAITLCLGILFSCYAIFRIVQDKFNPETRPRWFFWLGHAVLMILYSLLIGYLLR
ncbi:MAG: sigma 54-interacting transcriptional regulator [bacterium]